MNGTYFLSRVIKTGILNQEKLIHAILNPNVLAIGKYNWTFVDIEDHQDCKNNPFIYAKLACYESEGTVPVIKNGKMKDVAESDLLNAASPFVYLPNFSGIGYLRIWNKINESTFRTRFEKIIESVFDDFFVNCDLEPISDYHRFVEKLRVLESVDEISAKVNPPNPLFGHLWKDLKEYIESRNASEVQIKETSRKQGLRTDLCILINKIIKDRTYEPQKPADISDAAILMAADGYGKGSVKGVEKGNKVTIKTSDNQLNFNASKELAPDELAEIVYENLAKVSDERNMKH